MHHSFQSIESVSSQGKAPFRSRDVLKAVALPREKASSGSRKEITSTRDEPPSHSVDVLKQRYLNQKAESKSTVFSQQELTLAERHGIDLEAFRSQMQHVEAYPLTLRRETLRQNADGTPNPYYSFSAPDGTNVCRGIYPKDSTLQDTFQNSLVDIQQAQQIGHCEVRAWPDANYVYNCVSHTFTGGRGGWIEDNAQGRNAVDAILSNQSLGFQKTEYQHARVQDVVVYRNQNAAEHVGRVINITQGGTIWVESKWGAGPLMMHRMDALPQSLQGLTPEIWTTNHPSKGYLSAE